MLTGMASMGDTLDAVVVVTLVGCVGSSGTEEGLGVGGAIIFSIKPLIIGAIEWAITLDFSQAMRY